DRPGYISQDDRGRVFINHRPRTDPSEGWNVRVRDTQYIELTVTVRPTGGPLPADAKIRWTWSAPDDPSDTGMHAAAAQELDGNQDQGGDNRGCCDFPSPNGGEPVYEKIAPYLVTNAQAKQCETPVVNDKS